MTISKILSYMNGSLQGTLIFSERYGNSDRFRSLYLLKIFSKYTRINPRYCTEKANNLRTYQKLISLITILEKSKLDCLISNFAILKNTLIRIGKVLISYNGVVNKTENTNFNNSKEISKSNKFDSYFSDIWDIKIGDSTAVPLGKGGIPATALAGAMLGLPEEQEVPTPEQKKQLEDAAASDAEQKVKALDATTTVETYLDETYLTHETFFTFVPNKQEVLLTTTVQVQADIRPEVFSKRALTYISQLNMSADVHQISGNGFMLNTEYDVLDKAETSSFDPGYLPSNAKYPEKLVAFINLALYSSVSYEFQTELTKWYSVIQPTEKVDSYGLTGLGLSNVLDYSVKNVNELFSTRKMLFRSYVNRPAELSDLFNSTITSTQNFCSLILQIKQMERMLNVRNYDGCEASENNDWSTFDLMNRINIVDTTTFSQNNSLLTRTLNATASTPHIFVDLSYQLEYVALAFLAMSDVLPITLTTAGRLTYQDAVFSYELVKHKGFINLVTPQSSVLSNLINNFTPSVFLNPSFLNSMLNVLRNLTNISSDEHLVDQFMSFTNLHTCNFSDLKHWFSLPRLIIPNNLGLILVVDSTLPGINLATIPCNTYDMLRHAKYSGLKNALFDLFACAINLEIERSEYVEQEVESRKVFIISKLQRRLQSRETLNMFLKNAIGSSSIEVTKYILTEVVSDTFKRLFSLSDLKEKNSFQYSNYQSLFGCIHQNQSWSGSLLQIFNGNFKFNMTRTGQGTYHANYVSRNMLTFYLTSYLRSNLTSVLTLPDMVETSLPKYNVSTNRFAFTELIDLVGKTTRYLRPSSHGIISTAKRMIAMGSRADSTVPILTGNSTFSTPASAGGEYQNTVNAINRYYNWLKQFVKNSIVDISSEQVNALANALHSLTYGFSLGIADSGTLLVISVTSNAPRNEIMQLNSIIFNILNPALSGKTPIQFTIITENLDPDLFKFKLSNRVYSDRNISVSTDEPPGSDDDEDGEDGDDGGDKGDDNSGGRGDTNGGPPAAVSNNNGKKPKNNENCGNGSKNGFRSRKKPGNNDEPHNIGSYYSNDNTSITKHIQNVFYNNEMSSIILPNETDKSCFIDVIKSIYMDWFGINTDEFNLKRFLKYLKLSEKQYEHVLLSGIPRKLMIEIVDNIKIPICIIEHTDDLTVNFVHGCSRIPLYYISLNTKQSHVELIEFDDINNQLEFIINIQIDCGLPVELIQHSDIKISIIILSWYYNKSMYHEMITLNKFKREIIRDYNNIKIIKSANEIFKYLDNLYKKEQA